MDTRLTGQREIRDAARAPQVDPEAVGESRGEYERPDRAPRGFLAFLGTTTGDFVGVVALAVIMTIAIVVVTG